MRVNARTKNISNYDSDRGRRTKMTCVHTLLYPRAGNVTYGTCPTYERAVRIFVASRACTCARVRRTMSSPRGRAVDAAPTPVVLFTQAERWGIRAAGTTRTWASHDENAFFLSLSISRFSRHERRVYARGDRRAATDIVPPRETDWRGGGGTEYARNVTSKSCYAITFHASVWPRDDTASRNGNIITRAGDGRLITCELIAVFVVHTYTHAHAVVKKRSPRRAVPIIRIVRRAAVRADFSLRSPHGIGRTRRPRTLPVYARRLRGGADHGDGRRVRTPLAPPELLSKKNFVFFFRTIKLFRIFNPKT